MPQDSPLLNEEQTSRSVFGTSMRHVVVTECADISYVLWLFRKFCQKKLNASVFLIPVERIDPFPKLEDGICRPRSDRSEKAQFFTKLIILFNDRLYFFLLLPVHIFYFIYLCLKNVNFSRIGLNCAWGEIPLSVGKFRVTFDAL